MQTYTTVFEINRWSNGVLAEMLVRLAVGVGVLAVGLRGLLRRHVDGKARDRFGAGFLTFWGVAWLGMHLLGNPIGHVYRLVDAYTQGRYEVVEGEVSVGHVQPASGHSSGDAVTVGGRTFTVNYFVVTPAYRQTIAHGGVLRPGTYVRVALVDGEIVRLQVRQPASRKAEGAAGRG
jgi:hypothetical protein